MSRRPALDERSLHDRFISWLASGAAGEPPRDAALHATVCPACTAQVTALDLLAEIDPAAAGLPASRRAPDRAMGPLLRGIRVAGAVAGVAVLAVVSGTVLGQALLPRQAASGPGATETPVQAVLGGVGSNASSPTESAAPTGSPTPTATAVETIAPPPASAPPTVAPTARPRTPPPVTAQPTPRASPTAAATASPSATPTETPTPEPTATPTPTPAATPETTPEPTSVPTPEPTPIP